MNFTFLCCTSQKHRENINRFKASLMNDARDLYIPRAPYSAQRSHLSNPNRLNQPVVAEFGGPGIDFDDAEMLPPQQQNGEQRATSSMGEPADARTREVVFNFSRIFSVLFFLSSSFIFSFLFHLIFYYILRIESYFAFFPCIVLLPTLSFISRLLSILFSIFFFLRFFVLHHFFFFLGFFFLSFLLFYFSLACFFFFAVSFSQLFLLFIFFMSFVFCQLISYH